MPAITYRDLTSLEDLGVQVSMSDVDAALRASFEEIFGPVDAADKACEPVQASQIGAIPR